MGFKEAASAEWKEATPVLSRDTEKETTDLPEARALLTIERTSTELHPAVEGARKETEGHCKHEGAVSAFKPSSDQSLVFIPVTITLAAVVSESEAPYRESLAAVGRVAPMGK